MTDTAVQPDLDAQRRAFRDDLLAGGWLLRSHTDAIPGRGAKYIAVFDGLSSYISTIAAENDPDGTLTSVEFPPVISRDLLETTEYVASFPQLLGTIRTFNGGNAEHRRMIRAFDAGDDWESFLEPSALAIGSAGCHPLYAHLEGSRADGREYGLTAVCFRHEPSPDPMRMVSFRMREYVRIGTPEQAREHRAKWLALAREILESLGLDLVIEAANDPFFGRAGQLLATGQLESEVKLEILTEIYPGTLTSISSGNLHETHFGAAFDITQADGSPAHSACFAFGLDRIVLALVAHHGVDCGAWPTAVRAALGLPVA